MPLDTTKHDVSLLETTRGFRAAFGLTAKGPVPLSEEWADDVDTAKPVASVWRAIAALKGADSMLLRTGQDVCVASRRAGLIILGDKSLNPGMLRHKIKTMQKSRFTARLTLDQSGWTPEQKAVWAIAARLGRVEAPRVFEMMIGQFEYVLRVRKNSFAIVDDAGGAETLHARIVEAVGSEDAIEYTLGEDPAQANSSEHHIGALFGPGDCWRFASNGFPICVPQQAGFEDIETATAAVTSIATYSDDASLRADVLNKDGRPFWTLVRDEDAFDLKFQIDPTDS